MKPTTNLALPCTVFGHNYVKLETSTTKTADLKCSQCGIIVSTDEHGDFDDSCLSNKTIQSTLRQLFHLNKLITKPEFNSK
jgi:hypothetical protein